MHEILTLAWTGSSAGWQIAAVVEPSLCAQSPWATPAAKPKGSRQVRFFNSKPKYSRGRISCLEALHNAYHVTEHQLSIGAILLEADAPCQLLVNRLEGWPVVGHARPAVLHHRIPSSVHNKLVSNLIEHCIINRHTMIGATGWLLHDVAVNNEAKHLCIGLGGVAVHGARKSIHHSPPHIH